MQRRASKCFPLKTLIQYKDTGYLCHLKDPDGFLVAQRSIIYTVFLAISTLLVVALGFASWVYLVVVIALNFYLGVRAYFFLAPENKMGNAQKLFIASILYLPVLLIVLLLDISFFCV